MELGYDFIVPDMTWYANSLMSQLICDACKYLTTIGNGSYPTTGNCEFNEMTHCSAWPSLQKEDTRQRLRFLRLIFNLRYYLHAFLFISFE